MKCEHQVIPTIFLDFQTFIPFSLTNLDYKKFKSDFLWRVCLVLDVCLVQTSPHRQAEHQVLSMTFLIFIWQVATKAKLQYSSIFFVVFRSIIFFSTIIIISQVMRSSYNILAVITTLQYSTKLYKIYNSLSISTILIWQATRSSCRCTPSSSSPLSAPSTPKGLP